MRELRSSQLFLLFLLIIVEIFLGSFLHEGAHWLAGEVLGYDMQAGIGSARPVDVKEYRSVLDWQIINISGPLFTLAMAILGFAVLHSRGALWGYTFVFAAWFQRLLAMIISGISAYNDEARFSILLGWEWWVVPSMMVGILSILLFYSAYKFKIGWKAQFLFYLACSVGYSLVVFADGQFPGLQHPSPVLLP